MNIDGMEFETVNPEVRYVKPTELPTNGKYLVGQYKGTVEGKFGTNYKFAEKNAGTVIVNGCGSLKQAMENVEVGKWVAITFLGKEKLKKGKFAGRDFNNVQVALCKEPVTQTKGNEVSEDDIPF